MFHVEQAKVKIAAAAGDIRVSKFHNLLANKYL
jgi:hypothetical protein